MATTRTFTVEDMAERSNADNWELRRGELLIVQPLSFDRSDIALGIGSALRSHVLARGLGRVVGTDGGFILSRNPDTVLAPDAAFVRTAKLPPPEERQRFVEVVPDLVVEVVSPDDRASEVQETVQLYLEAGTQLVVGVYPRQRYVRTFSPDGASRRSREGDELDFNEIIPGLRLPVNDILA